jgi:hypothetical protein
VVEGSSITSQADFRASVPNSASIDRSIDDSAVLFPDFQIFPDSVPVRFGDFRALASEHAMSGGEAACARFAVEPSWFFKPCSPTPGRREWLSPPARRWQD